MSTATKPIQLVLHETRGKVVAVVYDDDGRQYDECWSWQTGQNYSNMGYRVVAIAADRYMDIEQAQELYDWERAIAADCFGPGVRDE